LNRLAMISLTLAKSARSTSRIVSLTMSSKLPPAAASTAAMLSNTRAACASMPPSTICIVAGSSAICPDIHSVPSRRIACEYGPMAEGALALWIACLVMSLSNVVGRV
jgi:hypothetical protein